MNKLNIILSIAIVLVLSACERQFNIGCISPEGTVETRTMSYDDFNDIQISLPCNVEFTQGPEHLVVIEAATNMVDRIESDSRNSGNNLVLEINGCWNLGPGDEINISITLPSLSAIKVDGASEITSTNELTIDNDLKVEIDGSANIELEIAIASLVQAEIDGAGEITLSGVCSEFKANIDGSGKIKAEDLNAEAVDINIDGTGDVNCSLSESIKIDIDGTGTIEAEGTAKTQEINIDGGGEIRNFKLSADNTDIVLSGIGTVEVTCLNNLDVKLEGAGNVCFKGNPTLNADIDGIGSVNDCN